MGFIKFLLKLSLIIVIFGALLFWYFYDQAHPVVSNSNNPLVVNDVTGLNPITVNAVIQPKSEQDVIDAIVSTQGAISIGGARYSMGGQIAYPDSLHLDMRTFNQILEFNPQKKIITVQTGITWREIQQHIDPHDLSIKIMQDFNNFTVGGALSVNAHGRPMGQGAIINSVRSIQIILANGQIYDASPEQNSDLFYGAIGGYGGLGVITRATLQLVDNVAIERTVTNLGFNEYLNFFLENVLNDDSVVLHNAVLYPPGFETVLDISWRESEKPLTQPLRLRQHDEDNWLRPVLVDLLARSNLLKMLRQHLIDPLIYNQPAVVMRNWESSYDLRDFGFLNSQNATLAMREYFVPVNKFEVFVLKLRDAFIRHKVDVLNVSVRYTPRDDKSVLSWAKNDIFSFMVVYRQGKDEESIAEVSEWSKDLLKGSIESRGSYYLPFQNQATSEQFHSAYPGVGRFLKIKKKADPANRFNNMLWAKYDNLLTSGEDSKKVLLHQQTNIK